MDQHVYVLKCRDTERYLTRDRIPVNRPLSTRSHSVMFGISAAPSKGWSVDILPVRSTARKTQPCKRHPVTPIRPPPRHTVCTRIASFPGSESAAGSASQSAANRIGIRPRIGGSFLLQSGTHRQGRRPSTPPQIGPASPRPYPIPKDTIRCPSTRTASSPLAGRIADLFTHRCRFLSEDWTPWIALLRMHERWPELRFEIKAGYLEIV